MEMEQTLLTTPTQKNITLFDKYHYYRLAVQGPENDVVFLRNTYRELKRSEPHCLREDFCGTFALSCEWVKMAPHLVAHGIDIDIEPLQYGATHYFNTLGRDEQTRLTIHRANVLDKNLPPADLVAAMNFSHFIFKTRSMLKEYFKNVHNQLNKDGLFIVDCFGGSQCQGAIEEETEHDGFSYFWDQENFDPVTNQARFHIHFKLKDQPKILNAFTYDWRLWSVPELRELMDEAGFRTTHVFWEGTTDDGQGSGIFTKTEIGEECESWIAYVVGEK